VTTRDYPTHPSELTSEWLTAQLRAAGAVKTAAVTGFSTVPVGEGIGMLGILVRVVPIYDRVEPGAPGSLIAKFATPVEGNRAVAMAFHIYEREILFYRLIAPTVSARAPRCFGCEIDPATGDSFLLLEDLSAYRTGDQVEGCSAAEAMGIIDAFVPLHVSFWGRTDDPVLGWVPHIDGETQIAGISAGCAAGWDPCVERFGHVMADEIKAARDRFVAAVPELHRMMGRRAQTLIHGDVRLDNMMFGTSPGQHTVVLLDWALTISTGLQDLAYLLSQNVTTQERRAHETELVEYYHRKLQELGIGGYSIEQCWADYRVAVLYLFCYAVVIGGTLDPSNERGTQFMAQLIDRASNTVIDHGLLSLLPTQVVP
jgi:hypothetical protein